MKDKDKNKDEEMSQLQLRKYFTLEKQEKQLIEEVEKMIKSEPRLDIAMQSEIRRTFMRFLYIQKKGREN